MNQICNPKTPLRTTLDPGHGGPDLGGIPGAPGTTEKAVNLAVAVRLADLLRNAGWEVGLTREGDEEVALSRRVEIAREFGSDVFLSIHHNATAWGDRELNRSEAYYQVGREGTDSERLAKLVVQEMERALGLGRLVLPAYSYHVLRENPLTAAIGEASHISHPDEALRLVQPARIEAEARAYATALQRWARGEGEVHPWVDAAWTKEATVDGGPRILLDPDGADSDRVDPPGYAEATLAVVDDLRIRLERRGIIVRSTRRSGETVGVADRVRRAFVFRPDATVTVSFDLVPCPLAQIPGSSRAYSRWPSSQRLSQCLAESCCQVLKTARAEALPGSDWLVMHGAPTFAACRVSPLSWYERTRMTNVSEVVQALADALVKFLSLNP